jgi:hypothetical protein
MNRICTSGCTTLKPFSIGGKRHVRVARRQAGNLLMNTSRAFWIVFGVLTALAVHLAYILFVPASQLADQTEKLIDEAGPNKLQIAESETMQPWALPSFPVNWSMPFVRL